MPLAMQNGFFQKRCPSVAKVKLQEKYHICMMLKSASKKVSLKRTHHSILLQTLLNFSTIGAIYASLTLGDKRVALCEVRTGHIHIKLEVFSNENVISSTVCLAKQEIGERPGPTQTHRGWFQF